MAEASIPVDLHNPGQAFACLGFMEAADILIGDAEGGFEWDTGEHDRFRLRARGDESPVETVLEFLAEAQVEAIGPPDGKVLAKEPGVPTVLSEAGLYPCPRPDTPSALPCRLKSREGRRTISISHWIDRSSAGIDNVKFWAGMAGYSGAALIRDLLAQVGDWSSNRRKAAVTDPFGVEDPSIACALQSSNLRFDYRGGTIPFDAGFSTNFHSAYAMVGFPLVDILAAIGLENARPRRVSKLVYCYGLWAGLLPLVFARAALGTASLGLPRRDVRVFRMELGWPGQENQARAIKIAQEEPQP